MTEKITIQGQTFYLHPDKAMYWQEKDMLLIADLHLGKVTHFRKHGTAIPNKAFLTNFKILTDLVNQFKPRIICVLGDLFHSDFNQEWEFFSEWITQTNLSIILSCR